MIDHMGITVSDFARSKAFYEAALAPVSVAPVMEVTAEDTGGSYVGTGFGSAGMPFFWIGAVPGGKAIGPVHVAFSAASRAEVDAFYKAAMAAGATDNGPPGLRPHYHPNYYGAFVLDPDGNNIEAVCHKPG